MRQDWIIRLHGLTAGYRGQAVLQAVNFSLRRGSFTALLGANGSGKSTLLKTILGLLPPVTGTVEYGQDTLPVIGYVPQQEQLDGNYPLSALDVVLMGTYARLKSGPAIPVAEHAFAHECLAAAGVAPLARQRFAHLSGGQKQRVLIARGLACRPDLLILDEPTSGVDAPATEAILELLTGIHRERRLTVLLVTHDFGIVRRHATWVAWLQRGRLTEGDPTELMRPAEVARMLELV